MSASAILSRLDGVQGRGPRYRAICPAHESKHKTRSLAVFEADDGRVLLRCFAGCEVEHIVGCLGLQLHDLFPPRVDDDKRPGRPRKPFAPAHAFQAITPDLIGAWAVLRKISAGQPITQAERAAAGRWASRVEDLVQAL
jgi:hypothetical protein